MNKKILFIAIGAVLCVILIISGILGGQKQGNDTTASETPKTPVTIAPPQADTTQAPSDTSSPETVPPPPYAGMTFTVLAPNSGDILLGDSIGGDIVSEAVYQRNLAVCQRTGATLLFKYSLDVYADIEAGSMAGNTAPHLLMLNMMSDGSRFLMNGGLADVSELYGRSEGLDRSFSDSMSVAEKQYFIVGDITPSIFLSRYYLKVNANSSAAARLVSVSQNGAITYDALFQIIADSKSSLYLDEQGIHALISDGLFSFADNGEASVDYEGYVKRAAALSAYKNFITSDTDVDNVISIGTYSGNGYVYLPLPTREDDSEGYVVDMSRLYPLAITDDCPDKIMSFELISLMLELSDGFTELVTDEYRLPHGANTVYCYYDIFGWGDFSKHAYNAFFGNKTDSLSKTLEAPKKASLQALSILLERNS